MALNNIRIHIPEGNGHAEVSVNGAQINLIRGYSVVQNPDEYCATVKLEFDVDGEVDINMNKIVKRLNEKGLL